MTALLEPPKKAKRTTASIDTQTASREHRWTRWDVYRLSDEGWFADKRINLFNGRIVVMPLPGPEHVYTVKRLAKILMTRIPASYHDRTENALGIGAFNDPGPDYAIVPGEMEDYITHHPTKAIFVAEIAGTTLKTDLHLKPRLYARAGIPEYWVVDLPNRCLVVHREPVANAKGKITGYADVQTLTEDQSVAPLFAPDHPIVVGSLLPPVSQ